MSSEGLLPLYGFVRGDTLGLLVLVRRSDTVQALVDSLQEAARVRVAPFARPVVLVQGQRLDPNLSLAAAGLAPLDRVDLVPEEPNGL